MTESVGNYKSSLRKGGIVLEKKTSSGSLSVTFEHTEKHSSRSLEKKGSSGSFNQKRGYIKTESGSSTTSDALDFLADMCVEIDDIEMTMTTTSSELPSNGSGKPGLNYHTKLQSEDFSTPSISSTPAAPPIPLKLIHLGENNVYIVPANPEHIKSLLVACKGIGKGEGAGRAITVSLEEGSSDQLASLVAAQQALKQNSSSTKRINPKHIYKTACDTYRVQMSKGSKSNPNGKFSRNARSETDALWLCEFALILIDRPNGFEDILSNGNYKCMLQRGIVRSPEDFAHKLGENLLDLESRDLLKTHEVERLHILLQKHMPQFQAQGTILTDVQGVYQPSSEPSSMYYSHSGQHMNVYSRPHFLYGVKEQPHWQQLHAPMYQHHQDSIHGLHSQQDYKSWNSSLNISKGSQLTSPLGILSENDRRKRRRVPSQQVTLSAPLEKHQYHQSHIPQQHDDMRTLPANNTLQYPNITLLTSQFVKRRTEARSFTYPEHPVMCDPRGSTTI